MGTGVPVGVTGPGGRWVAGSVPASASLYSMASGSSSISGWSKLIDEILSSFAHRFNKFDSQECLPFLPRVRPRRVARQVRILGNRRG